MSNTTTMYISTGDPGLDARETVREALGKAAKRFYIGDCPCEPSPTGFRMLIQGMTIDEVRAAMPDALVDTKPLDEAAVADYPYVKTAMVSQ